LEDETEKLAVPKYPTAFVTLELKVVEDTFPTTVNLLLLVVSHEKFEFPPNVPALELN